MNVIRPIKRIVDLADTNILTASFFAKRDIENEQNEFVDTLVFPTIQFLKKEDKQQKFNLLIDEKFFTKELGIKFNGYTYGIGKIVRLAEINNDRLSRFVKNYFDLNDLEQFYCRNAESSKLTEYDIAKNINSLTFGNLVNILRNIVKTDNSFHSIPGLSSESKRKEFRKMYFDYVEDRDYFTHGILFFEYPGFMPILRVKGKNGEEFFINYSKEIFLSNLTTFNYLFDIVEEMIKQLKK